MRGGFTSVDDYGRDVNRDFRDYYGNVARNLSADSIVRVGFNDNNVRHIPYVRGSLYFADLDSKIRAYSKGRRNLDKVLFDVFQSRERGARFTHDTWKQIVEQEAGPGSADAFERIILRGETVLPASDAFGPCFERRPTRIMVGGVERDSYEWVRVASIPDEKCREP
jgi:predicted metalloprotease with PDZ domain